MDKNSGRSMDDSNLRQVCTLLDKFGIGEDLEWLSVVLFVRNLVRHLSVFDGEQKAAIQRLVFKELAARDFSPARFDRVVRELDAFVMQNSGTREVEEQLRLERTSAAALVEELKAFLEGLRRANKSNQDRVERLGRHTVQAVESGQPKEAIVSGIRTMLAGLLTELREEAREWEERAKSLERTAMFDPLLTELYNRRALDAFLNEAVRRHIEHGRPLSLMMIDVDHFKRVNDTHGHQTGDEVLRVLSKLVAAHSVQFEGFAARYGGEEVAVICEGLGLEEAGLRAEALSHDVEKYEVALRKEGAVTGSLHFTVSVGVAEIQPDWQAAELLGAADRALYRAKNAGRNVVARHSGNV